jgi:peptidyl-dipeptidase Dcp
LTDAELHGLPPSLVSGLAQAAAARGKTGHLVTLARSLVVPLLTLSPDRSLRQRVWQAWVERGRLDPQRDNLKIANEILVLRQELALLYGLLDYAVFALRDTMVQHTARVTALLEQVWHRAVAKAEADREMLW